MAPARRRLGPAAGRFFKYEVAMNSPTQSIVFEKTDAITGGKMGRVPIMEVSDGANCLLVKLEGDTPERVIEAVLHAVAEAGV